ncbi:transcription factor Pcc1-domain-containing protein [Staphylotrichum tortipilum]|uniref:Transcription factor Pcc1-domain-containing protein n=1 Tax=Staphylotrichum tortipilum TaxID=2831512 RepID=A0AAN6MMD2_9PEZI|nr:transcription factor Pcc1-domain-containing protein [Staphylotrichum longicolle]
MATDATPTFPCALTLDVPFPDARLASVALQALRVDKELSSLVARDLSVVVGAEGSTPAHPTVLRVEYKAATNRMLRVAVNSFLESLALVLEVQAELDVDVLGEGQAQEGSG